jgi:hypothetical protein
LLLVIGCKGRFVGKDNLGKDPRKRYASAVNFDMSST